VNELQQLEQLLEELLAGIQTVLMSGEALDDNIQGMLAKELAATLARIEELRAQNPVEGLPPTPAAQPELNPSMPSSNINSFSYDDKTGNLLVKFQGDYPQENGPIYSYGGVPKQIFDLFQKGAVPARTDGKNAWGKWWKGKVPSMGASMYTLIKGGNYPYQKIS
jgi:hypothetical protein